MTGSLALQPPPAAQPSSSAEARRKKAARTGSLAAPCSHVSPISALTTGSISSSVALRTQVLVKLSKVELNTAAPGNSARTSAKSASISATESGGPALSPRHANTSAWLSPGSTTASSVLVPP